MYWLIIGKNIKAYREETKQSKAWQFWPQEKTLKWNILFKISHEQNDIIRGMKKRKTGLANFKSLVNIQDLKKQTTTK